MTSIQHADIGYIISGVIGEIALLSITYNSFCGVNGEVGGGLGL